MLFWIIIAFCTVLISTNGQSYDGSLCGFTDINLDRRTDVIVAVEASVEVYLASKKDNTFSKGNYTFAFVPSLSKGVKIVNCAAGDFDGDMFPELLLSIEESEKRFKIALCLTKPEDRKSFNCSIRWENARSQPNIGTFRQNDGDSIARDDFFYVNDTGHGVCVYGKKHISDFREGESCFNKDDKVLDDLTTIVYAPLTSTKTSMFTIVGDKEAMIWNWNSSDRWRNIQTVDLTGLAKLKGFVTVADLDADASNELLFPSADGEKLRLLVVRPGLKTEVEISLVPGTSVVATQYDKFHLRIGDFNLDGFPDLLLVLKSSTETAAYIGFNEVNTSNALGRGFSLQRAQSGFVEKEQGVLAQAAFFDLGENGELDLVEEFYPKTGGGSAFQFTESVDQGDTNFFRVQVFTANCDGGDGSQMTATGTSIFYDSVSETGAPIHGIYTQLSQSSYNALQLPYALFGLGRTPNFVETMGVALPGPNKEVPQWEWPQLIPNSRVYVIPCGKPRNWTSKLYLTPDRIILQSLAALCCICIVILALVLILHWREVVADKKERQQESHRFHFDAM